MRNPTLHPNPAGSAQPLCRALRTASAWLLDRLRGNSTLNLILRSPFALGVLLMGIPSPRTSFTESGPTTYHRQPLVVSHAVNLATQQMCRNEHNMFCLANDFLLSRKP